MGTVQCGDRLFNYFRVVGGDHGGSRFSHFAREGQKFFQLRGDKGEDLYLLESKLDEIRANPPNSVVLGGISFPLTYNDIRQTQINYILRYGINRANIRFV